MASVATISGVRTVINNLRRKDRAFQAGVARGLKKGGLLLQRAAQLKVPVDTGALKASAYTRAQGTGFQTLVTVGFDTAYAMFVHEAKGTYWGKGIPRAPRFSGQKAHGNYWDPFPTSVPKYLSIAIALNTKQIVSVVRLEAWKAKYA